MIDEQHPMQIGMFPMDIKCHTPQQLQQQQTSMLMSGNERMLTTSTAGATTTIPAAAPVTTATTTMTPNEIVNGKNGNGNTAAANPTMVTVTNVNGSCNNHSNSNNNKTNNSANNIQQSQTNPDGPGPPSTINATNALSSSCSSSCSSSSSSVVSTCSSITTLSGRITLGECNLNGGGSIASCGNVGNVIGSLCVNNNSNNGVLPLSLQHHLQQQQQHQLQMHPPHTTSILLQHHHQHQHHPAAILPNTSACAAAAAMGDSCGSGISPSSHHRHHLLTQCGYCCQPICDRYIMRVVDTSFHESCLKCATCSLHLVQSCFARDGKLYCRIDYERLFIRNRCLGCGHKIASDELVMRTLENVFHLKCFACVVCGALLKKGEQYVVKQGQLFCRFDYEKEVEMLQGYDFYGDDLFPPKLDGRRGPKRPRTILNTQQRRAFKASFEVSPKPCRKVRENLAKETGLSLRIVQVWFQNQRAKVKKIQKKAKQEHVKGASDSQDSQESDNSLAKIKDEAHSDNESLLESPFSSCGAGGGSSSDGVAKMRCIKDENENAPFNCMETNKENCNKTNEPILNTILGLSYATFQQLMGPFTQSPMINPIDRLYSMQNSYFRPEELSYGECGKDVAEN